MFSSLEALEPFYHIKCRLTTLDRGLYNNLLLLALHIGSFINFLGHLRGKMDIAIIRKYTMNTCAKFSHVSGFSAIKTGMRIYCSAIRGNSTKVKVGLVIHE